MATGATQLKRPAPVAGGDEDPLAKECLRRVERAKVDRGRHQSRIADCYRFALPWRHKFGAAQVSDQLDEIFDETAMNVVEDFAADMLNTFTPQRNDWVSIQPAVTLDVADTRRIAAELKDYQAILFGEMARSNLYQALQESYLDLATGTMSLTVQDIDFAEPIHCQAIPLTELLIDRGPYGFVDGRWREWRVRKEEIPVLWPRARAPGGQEFRPGDMTECDVIDGCWRDWSDRSREAYRYVVIEGGRVIFRDDYEGAGSCPFITARWSRDPTTAYGVGPLYRSTPAVKTLNHVRFLSLKNYDKIVDPPASYEDDGVLNVEGGIVPGRWYPREVGSKAPEVIESRHQLNVEIFQLDELRSQIRRAHYQDRPEQLGKTPPTATQWADEAAERARRMGTPATNLVQELQYPLVRRFAYLLRKRGALPKVELNGAAVALTPVSPLLRAQEQEKVVRRDKWAELIIARFGPQLGAIVINLIEYAKAQGRDLGVEPELMRDEGQITRAIEQLLPVLQTVTAGRPGEIAPPPVGLVG
ncbi:MAG: phage tail protein [Thermomicrobiales bacterium]|nr:phage tail protein [Thermomicrobiales bacterium]